MDWQNDDLLKLDVAKALLDYLNHVSTQSPLVDYYQDNKHFRRILQGWKLQQDKVESCFAYSSRDYFADKGIIYKPRVQGRRSVCYEST
jgi:hypothetical protein